MILFFFNLVFKYSTLYLPTPTGLRDEVVIY